MKTCFMLHSVLYGIRWPYERLTTTEDELLGLVRLYRTLGFSFVKACDLFSTKGNAVALTFDDGYLDNWTCVFPLLESKGIPFTVFVNKDFVVMDDVVRPHGQKHPGYLSVGELRRMHESGLVDIQSHSESHTWYPVSSVVQDIFTANHKPTYPWLFWNKYPGRKTCWMESSYDEFIGMPVFENDRSLRARRYLFDEEALSSFQSQVQSQHLAVEEANALWIREFADCGRLETVKEQQDRYWHEIFNNASFIENLLGFWPDVLCWPGGAYNSLSCDIAYEFHSCTTIKKGYGRDNRYMYRISPGNPDGRNKFPWKYYRLTLLYYTFRQLMGSRFGSTRKH